MEKNLLKHNNNNNNNNDDEPFIENDHRGLKTFIVIAIIFLLLGGLSIFYYFKIYNNPLIVAGNIINNFKNNLNIPNNNANGIKLSGGIEFDVKSEDQSAQDIAKILNNLKLQYTLSTDIKNQYSIAELYTKYYDEQLVNAKIILEQNNKLGYIYLDNLYDKYLKTSIDINDNNTNKLENTNINYQIIINGIFNALNKSINENDFERTEVEINVNNKNLNCYQNSLIINNDNYQRINKIFITELKNNENFINEISKFDKSINVKEKLDETLNEINKEKFNDIIKINFYTKRSFKQELLKLEFIQIDEFGNNNILFTPINNKEFTIDINIYNTNLGTISFKKNSQNNILIKFTYYNNNNNNDCISSILNITYEEIKQLDKIDISSNINIKELTKDDKNKIMENFSNNQGLNNLKNDIANIFSIDIKKLLGK